MALIGSNIIDLVTSSTLEQVTSHFEDEAKLASEGGLVLHLASEHGRPEIVRLLLILGVSASAWQGQPALVSAAYLGHAEVIRVLAEFGTDIEEPDIRGFTPLAAAASKGRKEAVQELLKLGANVNTAASSGLTPLMLAAKCGHNEIIEMLLRAGADPNLAERHGWTALEFAEYRKDEGAIRLLSE